MKYYREFSVLLNLQNYVLSGIVRSRTQIMEFVCLFCFDSLKTCKCYLLDADRLEKIECRK
jgi:hypothetical protein